MSGDFISKEYSGTESVLTQVALKGHQNSLDKVKHKMMVFGPQPSGGVEV